MSSSASVWLIKGAQSGMVGSVLQLVSTPQNQQHLLDLEPYINVYLREAKVRLRQLFDAHDRDRSGALLRAPGASVSRL